MNNKYSSCALCMRKCGVNRNIGQLGFCKSDAEMSVCRADLHMWEEPIISGERGSGTVFFSGCSLGCIYCQNRKISRSQLGRRVSASELADIMLSLEARGAHNVNFVTPTHFAPGIVESVEIARGRGLIIPTVYNTGSYDAPETIDFLSDTVDVYLPDLKYYLPKTAEKFSSAKNYPESARAAIERMVKQKGAPVLKDGIIQRGVVVRILILPQHVAEAKLSLKYLYSTFGNDIYISLMSQYTPGENMPLPLNRRLTKGEYEEICEYALSLGVKNVFAQDMDSAEEVYIPDFQI